MLVEADIMFRIFHERSYACSGLFNSEEVEVQTHDAGFREKKKFNEMFN